MIETPSGDRRFKDDAWKENEVFDFIKQSYLLSARFVQDVVTHVDGLDPKTAQKVDFYSRQFVDAMSPSNFLLTNPEVLRKTAETGGENLLKGLNNLLGDLERGKGKLHIKMTDMEAFKVGENIGVSPGKVVYQNDLMQLIQYDPATETVLKRPLLIGPPWINKFYILDLRPRNSFVRWAVSQGHTVFMISWVNPDETLSEKEFEDYMRMGYLDALDAIEQATGEREVNAIGYCLGGTLLSRTLAYMAAKGDDRIKSATFFVTMMDFQEAGELGVFIDEEQLSRARGEDEQARLSRRQRDGDDVQHAARQRPDLVVRGQQLPAGQRAVPVRPAVLEQRFDPHAGADAQLLSAQDVPGEPAGERPAASSWRACRSTCGKIKTPAYFLSTREDHIAPWKSTYRGTQLLGGEKRFVLAAVGHIAGVVNPPDSGKYSHWINPELPPDPEQWFHGATEIAGSWWPDWQRWITAMDKTQVPARIPGDGQAEGDRGCARQLCEGDAVLRLWAEAIRGNHAP